MTTRMSPGRDWAVWERSAMAGEVAGGGRADGDEGREERGRQQTAVTGSVSVRVG
jgi:hypothetical protein